MRLITDWHVHSKYSRACSRDLELPKIADMCRRKGIDVVATGDWTHPAWFEHLKDNLVESEPGIYSHGGIRFMLVTEISQIYKRDGKTRRIHNLIFSPSLETCAKVNAELDRRGLNRRSDGRPILGIDSEELYKILKSIDERIIVIPAHAWTPWYSVFGSKSGFDSLEECFGEMAKYVYAIETGLSSDPMMNWQISGLDNVMLISNSDAHSLDKLGREANIFDLEPSYDEFVRVLRDQDRSKFLSTIEFFPEEGKYHQEVEHRIKEIADRDAHIGTAAYRSIVPLKEVIAGAFGVGVSSKKVADEYLRLTDRIANEFVLLLETPIKAIVQENATVAEGIRRVREGQLTITPGHDGIYGTVKIF